MPELPEVETIRARLQPVLLERRLEAVKIFDARLTRPFDPRSVAASLEGERVAALDRRGKYLVVRFDSGRSLLIHLRMTGTLVHDENGARANDPYRRAVITLDNGADIAYRDVRRFGTWLVLDGDELDPYLAARIGVEPLGRNFSAAVLAERLAGRRTSVKAALLDQRAVAGVGNIYADEALWRAGINPRRPAGSLAAHELRALHRALRRALAHGIARHGATLRDYRTPGGEPGSMQREFKVYGREGEPCERCGTAIEKIRAAGRGTWYCPRCQT
ncbi:MAG: bifunctional DNA-formamidopyrimidine glycosylase/DNA-(apurinic or apyrimidinic site) lyase [Actinomycetota bacterium]|nr:bifunctional DNA-formamidopyrimidine glycosylase/DNA-(apurinic or apyrimidinic site) lyase [Actinomycetota bacterium]